MYYYTSMESIWYAYMYTKYYQAQGMYVVHTYTINSKIVALIEPWGAVATVKNQTGPAHMGTPGN